MNYTPITQWSDDDKPREKLARWGAEKLSDSELLAILISTGSRGKSAITLAKELLQAADNDINQLARFDIPDIKKIKGLGDAKAITIIAALELNKRRNNKNQTIKIDSIYSAVDLLRPILQDKIQEHFYIILLSQRNHVLKTTEIGKGGISSVIVDPRIILKEAITHHASGIILAHNHPSGNNKPSDADNALTKKIAEGAKLMDIKLLDHIIIAKDLYYSYAEEATLP